MSRQLIIRLLFVAGLASIFVFFNVRAKPAPSAAEVLGSTKEGNYITIKKIGVAAPLVFDELTDALSVVHALKKGVVHFTGMGLPGEVGNSYFFAKEIFEDLPMMAAGDEIEIVFQGRQFVYTVSEIRVIDPLDVSVFSEETDGQRILTLQTSYPLGSVEQRFIVIASIK